MKKRRNKPGRRAARKPARGGAERGGAERDENSTERVQKVLAASGLGSRRSLEQRIRDGEILINSRPAELGSQVGVGDQITMNGRRLQVFSEKPQPRTLVYNKPLGQVTTRKDPEGRPTVFEQMPKLRRARWIAVGRLDINTSGLLLMTTDGELANQMMHPSSQVDREYACRIHGEVSPAQLEQLKRGVELEDGPAQFSDIQAAGHSGENYWYHVVIMEGRNREVRRLWQSQGVQVSRLKRVRYGAVFLPKGLREGQWRELSSADHRILRQDVGLANARPVLKAKAVTR